MSGPAARNASRVRGAAMAHRRRSRWRVVEHEHAPVPPLTRRPFGVIGMPASGRFCLLRVVRAQCPSGR